MWLCLALALCPKGTKKKPRKAKETAGTTSRAVVASVDHTAVMPRVAGTGDNLSALPVSGAASLIQPRNVHDQDQLNQDGNDEEESSNAEHRADLNRVGADRAGLGADGAGTVAEGAGLAAEGAGLGATGAGLVADGVVLPREQGPEPTMREVLAVLMGYGAQMTALTQAVLPMVNSAVGQGAAIPVAAPLVRERARGAEEAAELEEVVELEPPARSGRRIDYLKVLEHISKLGTKHFAGSVDPIEADEWRSRLVRNFSSTRCPEDYKKDIAVHFLEGDAHNWWLALDKRTNGTIRRFADFEVEFNHKYFPAEAWDRLESQFLDLTQGRRTVREYEEEFNRLRRFVGRELEDEAVQVRRFIRGLRVELRTYCSVRTFHSVSELVERMAMLETNLAEESKLKVKSVVVSTSRGNDRKRKRDQAEEGKTSSGRPECPKCGKHHGGECWRAMGACLRCGQMDHAVRDCPKKDQDASGDTRSCHYCGKKGHLRKDCPKLQSGQSKGRSESSKAGQDRGQTSAPRVYELSKDTNEAGPFKAITGNDT